MYTSIGDIIENFEEDVHDISSVHDPDSSFCERDVEYPDSEDPDKETAEIQNTDTNPPAPPRSCLIVYWSALVILLSRCLTCNFLASITKCAVSKWVINCCRNLFVKNLTETNGSHNPY